MKTIQLSKPITGARGPVAALRFREPVFSDVMELGDPETPIYREGSVIVQQHSTIIGQYAEKLLIDEDVNLLHQANLRDTLAIRDAVIGFFREAQRPIDLGASPTNSSSTSDGTPAASAA